MCTITFVPLEKGFVFTSNRDEHVSRSDVDFPSEIVTNGKTVYFPKDPLANGTWIAASETQLICLINGGFVKHSHRPPYRKSRGLIVLDQFEFEHFKTFTEKISLLDIEPFTMVSIEWEGQEEILLTELIWDGQVKHVRNLGAKEPQIWSSSTLYSPEIKIARQKIFLESSLTTPSELIDFHTNAGAELGDENRFKMKRSNNLCTLSCSQFIKNNSILTFENINYKSTISKQISYEISTNN